MAQTKTKSRSSSNGSSGRSRAKASSNGSKSKNGSKTRATAKNGSKARATKSTARKPASRAKSQVKKATGPLPSGEQLAKLGEKAKTPAIAAGAAIAGIAGGMALKNGKGRSKALKKLPKPSLNLSLPKPRRSTAKVVAGAAKEVAKGGYAIGQLTSEVRKVREAVEKK